MKKYENFCRSLDNLADIFREGEPSGNVAIAGMVALFQICFEQSWKAMKEILEDSGYGGAKTGAPRQIIKTAWQADMLQDEELWLSALADRNNAAHAYNEAIAKAIIRNTKERYYGMFLELRRTLEAHWL